MEHLSERSGKQVVDVLVLRNMQKIREEEMNISPRAHERRT